MKKLLLTTILAFSFSAHATPAPALPPAIPAVPAYGLPSGVPSPEGLTLKVSRGESLFEITRLVLADILKVQFYIAPELVNSTDTVSVNLLGLSKENALSVLTEILKTRGYSVNKGKVYFITKSETSVERKKTEEPTESFTYSVNHPKAFYALSSQLPVIFPAVCFSFGQCSEDKLPATTVQKLAKDELAPSTFVVVAPVSQVKAVKAQLEKLDSPLPRIYLKTALYEVSSNESAGNGIALALSLLNNKLNLKIGDDLGIKQGITFNSPNASLVFGTLDGDSRFKSLTTPELSIINGATASISSGSQYPIPTTKTTDKDTTQTYDFKDTGVIVNITPELFPTSALLNVGFEISDVSKYASATSVPIFNTSKFNVQTTVNYGQAFILGGINIDKEVQSTTSFFSFNTSKSTDRTKRQLVLVGYVERE